MKKLLLLLAFPIVGISAQVQGTWKLAPQAGALGVGPGLGDISWWSNGVVDVTTRACLFDDSITFNANGTMMHYMNGQTWLEGWQGAIPDACGTPVAPHNGANPSMTYAYNGTNNTLSVYGLGAHLGLAKVINGAEINTPLNASDTITYMTAFSNGGNTMTLDINFGPGYWRFVYNRTQMIPVSNYNVTFRVNMEQYTGSTANGVFLNGTFNNWCGSCTPMTNVSGSLWEVVLPLAPGAIEFKYTVNGWNDQENFLGGEPCTVTNGGFTNRSHVVAGDATLPSYCFGSCDICTNPVSFMVNMNDFVTGGGSTMAGVFLNGTFNGWCGSCTPMTDVNMDGIWEVTAAIPTGNIEYKFTVDGWNISEQFVGGEPCTITTGGFTNRAGAVSSSMTNMAVVCWESCVDCPAGLNDASMLDLIVSPNPASTFVNVAGNSELIKISLFDLNGRLVNTSNVSGLNANLSLEGVQSGMYQLFVETVNGVKTSKVLVK